MSMVKIGTAKAYPSLCHLLFFKKQMQQKFNQTASTTYYTPWTLFKPQSIIEINVGDGSQQGSCLMLG